MKVGVEQLSQDMHALERLGWESLSVTQSLAYRPLRAGTKASRRGNCHLVSGVCSLPKSGQGVRSTVLLYSILGAQGVGYPYGVVTTHLTVLLSQAITTIGSGPRGAEALVLSLASRSRRSQGRIDKRDERNGGGATDYAVPAHVLGESIMESPGGSWSIDCQSRPAFPV